MRDLPDRWEWLNYNGCAAALLCLSNAKEGGLSGWSSSISVHNEIVRRRPDLARVLAGPWFMDRKGEVPEGKKGYFELPVFNYHEVMALTCLDVNQKIPGTL
jgi:hypothetical protein